jgi:succinyl-diaminopimelate desuccinylase
MPPLADLNTEEVGRLAAALCRIPSPSGSEAGVADFVASYLRAGGIDVHVQEVVPGRPNVIARVGRPGGRQLVLVAHLDSSTAGDWQRDPFEPIFDGDRLEAGGITDMKGGLAAMLVATRACVDAELDGEVVLLCAMGHSPLGLGTKYALETEGPWNGIAIFGQSSGMKAQLANGGSIKFEILVSGRTAHIANGADAVDALRAARSIANRLEHVAFSHDTHPRLPDLPRMVVGEFSAGASVARVPGSAVLRGDIRTVPGMSRHTVLGDLARAVAEAELDPRISVSARVTHVQTPFIGDPNGRAMELLSAAHGAVLGAALEQARGLPGEAFITDATDLVRVGLDTVMYGPATWRNEPGEWASVQELGIAARVYSELARLACGPTGATTGR